MHDPQGCIPERCDQEAQQHPSGIDFVAKILGFEHLRRWVLIRQAIPGPQHEKNNRCPCSKNNGRCREELHLCNAKFLIKSGREAAPA
jgi:hypothetical protein